MLLTVWKINGNNVTLNLKIDDEAYSKANEEKKAKAFFLRLVEVLSVNGGKDLLCKASQESLKELSLSLAKANGFADLYSPKDGKPFYNSFREALRVKRANDAEKAWQSAVERWRSAFSGKIEKAAKRYEKLLSPSQLKIVKKIADEGWFFSPYTFKKLGISSQRITSKGIMRKISKFFACRSDLESELKKWSSLKSFSKRRKILNSAFSAYKRREYEIAIYALFPQTEGVVWDFLLAANPMEGEMEELIRFQNRKFVTVEAVMREMMKAVSNQEKVPFYRWVKFAQYEESHDLNRHAIEHGISIDFGTRENFFKLFFFLDFLHYMLSECEKGMNTMNAKGVIKVSNITSNVKSILAELPENVQLVAAAKTRSAQEIEEAIRAGVKIIGENYVQEAEKVFPLVHEKAEWHFIGSIQKNKINKIIRIFDVVETVDSFETAFEIDKRCAKIGRIMPVFIEVNSAKEPQKSGAMPEEVEKVVEKISKLENVRVLGLMTMGPRTGSPEEARKYFKITKEVFDKLKEKQIPNVDMKYLSMGMSNSYRVAIEEGANIVRIGTKIFGERHYDK